MPPDAQTPFTKIVELFLEQWCETGTDSTVSDKPLCTKFHAFYTRVTKGAVSGALLEAFRADLVQRGYQLVEGKRRYWFGLTLRKKWNKPVVDWSARQQELLLLLTQREYWSIGEIARELHLSFPTASRAVDHLKNRRLVTCGIGESNRRRVLVRLTPLGNEIGHALTDEGRHI